MLSPARAPRYASDADVAAHLEVSADTLRALRADSRAAGIALPCLDWNGAGRRAWWRWELDGGRDPWGKIDRWAREVIQWRASRSERRARVAAGMSAGATTARAEAGAAPSAPAKPLAPSSAPSSSRTTSAGRTWTRPRLLDG